MINFLKDYLALPDSPWTNLVLFDIVAIPILVIIVSIFSNNVW